MLCYYMIPLAASALISTFQRLSCTLRKNPGLVNEYLRHYSLVVCLCFSGAALFIELAFLEKI